MNDTDPTRPGPDRTCGQAPPPCTRAPRGVRSWHGDGFRIDLHPRRRTGDGTAIQLSYRVFDTVWAGRSGHDHLVFAGDDLLSAADLGAGTATARAVSAIFGCEAGDVADSFFDAYSPLQRSWRDARAGDLGAWGSTLGPHT